MASCKGRLADGVCDPEWTENRHPVQRTELSCFTESGNDGYHNITGKVHDDGTVDIYAITSTVSASGDQGAHPDKLVKVTDLLKASSLPLKDGDHDANDNTPERFSHFVPRRRAKFSRNIVCSDGQRR